MGDPGGFGAQFLLIQGSGFMQVGLGELLFFPIQVFISSVPDQQLFKPQVRGKGKIRETKETN